MRVDVVQLVREGKGRFEWSEVRSEHGGNVLFVSVFRDAMRFDAMPAMTWNRTVLDAGRTFDGVRLPATAAELQQIADMMTCSLLTPKVLDLVWQQAALRFDPVVNLGPGKIVAVQDVNDVHEAVERKIAAAGGYPSEGIVASVGKYWVLSNHLVPPVPDGRKYGIKTACNYGWNSSGGAYAAVTPGLKVWQGEGTEHNDEHIDPSQVVRLMYRFGRLIRGGGAEEQVDVLEVAQDKDLWPLVCSSAPLRYLRQISVPEPQASTAEDGTLVMPEVTIYPSPAWASGG